MLSALLETIKGQLTSKSYWVGSMLPLLLFLFASGVLVERQSGAISIWLRSADSLDQKTFLYATILGCLIILAYILSSLNSFLLECLEGKRGPLLWIGPALYKGEWLALRALDSRYSEVVANRDFLRDHSEPWIDALRRARKEGDSRGRLLKAFDVNSVFALIDPDWHTRSIAKVLFRRSHGCELSPLLLRRATIGLRTILRKYAASKSRTLAQAQADLVEAIKYGSDQCRAERIRLFNKRQFTFPGVRPSSKTEAHSGINMLAPTRFGNIGRTMRSYTLTRYNFDLDIMWTRLQNAIQKNPGDFYSTLQDSKAQVDFLVSLVWLTFVFTAFWSIQLLFCGNANITEFLSVGLGGAILTVLWYVLACRSYQVFADLMRSAVDMFRFKVLNLLDLPLPYGSNEERELWQQVANAMGFEGDEGFRFDHKSS